MARKATASSGVAENAAPSLFSPDDGETPTRPIPALSADGHRARMRTKLLKAGPDAIADHELIEMVLFLALPRRDTKPLARTLLGRFGNFAGCVSASVPELREIEGLGDAAIAALKTVQAAAHRLARTELAELTLLNSWDKLITYLHSVLAREKIEQFRILFLDSRNRLLADEVQGKGTINHTPVYPREIIKRALELHATAIILVHNHPSGDPTPSRDDISMTQTIIRAAEPVGVTVHDHIIIGKSGWTSLKQKKLL